MSEKSYDAITEGGTRPEEPTRAAIMFAPVPVQHSLSSPFTWKEDARPMLFPEEMSNADRLVTIAVASNFVILSSPRSTSERTPLYSGTRQVGPTGRWHVPDIHNYCTPEGCMCTSLRIRSGCTTFVWSENFPKHILNLTMHEVVAAWHVSPSLVSCVNVATLLTRSDCQLGKCSRPSALAHWPPTHKCLQKS